MRKSDVDAQSVRDGMNVSDEARAAIRVAMARLQPYVGEDPRIAALVSKLGAIEDPEPLAKSDRLADNLARVIKAEWDVIRKDGLSLADRQQTQVATRDAQIAYLREMSPAAAAAWERHAGPARR